MGVWRLIFGTETQKVSAFTGPDCPISERVRTAVGVDARVGGALFSLIG
jgi:hypothetical protein